MKVVTIQIWKLLEKVGNKKKRNQDKEKRKKRKESRKGSGKK